MRGGGLPHQPGVLVGREAELAAALALLQRPDVRLLTLTGTGGTGKTRLANEVAASLHGKYSSGVYFVDLASLADPQLVVPAIAQALGVRDTGSRPLTQRVHEYLRPRQVLLVLDNFEHLLAAAPDVAAVLAACPRLKVLATSRARLHLRWEHEFPVPPLTLPDVADLGTPDAVARVPAVALFLQVAAAARHGFWLTEANTRAVAEICVGLDGLPLAVELAAARIKVLSPEAILARLDRRLALLTGGGRDQPARHQTLEAALSWSYDLLGEARQALFRRLGVFAGGWSLAAAEAVCPPASCQVDVLDGLSALVDHSLVRQELLPNGEVRFGMLETVREFAVERLSESGEAGEAYRCHAAYALSLAEQADAKLKSAAQWEWLALLDREHDNLRVALARCLAPPGDLERAEVAQRIASGLAWFWWLRGHCGEGRRWLEAALAASNRTPAEVRALAYHGQGILANAQGDFAHAIRCYQQSHDLWRQAGNTWGIALSLGSTAMALWTHTGAQRSPVLALREALALFRQLGDKWHTAWALRMLGRAALRDRGAADEAKVLFTEALALLREVGDAWATAHVLTELSVMARRRGDLASARQQVEEALALHRKLGVPRSVGITLLQLGHIAREEDEHTRARDCCREALVIFRDVGDKSGIGSALFGFARAAAAQDRQQAARLMGAAQRLAEGADIDSRYVFGAGYEDALRAVLGDPANPSTAAAWEEGKAMPLEQAIADALAPEQRAAPTLAPSGTTYDQAAVDASQAPGSARGSAGRRALPGRLTAREVEVLRHVAAGKTNREVAAVLFLSEKTVGNHLASVYAKLGVASRAAATAFALRHGLA